MMRFVISLLGFLIAGAVFMLYTKPTYDAVKALQTNITDYDQALERANELQALKQSLLSRYNAFNPDDIHRLTKLLPDHVDNVRLVLDFDNLASKHSLAIQNVAVGRGDGKEIDTGSAQQVIGGNQNKYDSLTLKFSTQGTYPKFVSFMEDVQSSLRIVDLVSLTLSNASGGQDTGGEPVYQYDVTIRTYWLK